MHDIYGIPVAVLIGVGVGMLASAAIYVFYPKSENKEKISGLVGVGAGLVAAGFAAVLLPRI